VHGEAGGGEICWAHIVYACVSEILFYSLIINPTLVFVQCPFITQKYMKKVAAKFRPGQENGKKEYKRRHLPSSFRYGRG
jgi:hypothetical protein